MGEREDGREREREEREREREFITNIHHMQICALVFKNLLAKIITSPSQSAPITRIPTNLTPVPVQVKTKPRVYFKTYKELHLRAV